MRRRGGTIAKDVIDCPIGKVLSFPPVAYAKAEGVKAENDPDHVDAATRHVSHDQKHMLERRRRQRDHGANLRIQFHAIILHAERETASYIRVNPPFLHSAADERPDISKLGRPRERGRIIPQEMVEREER